MPDRETALAERTWSRLLVEGRYEYREHGFTLSSGGHSDRHLVRHVVHRGDSAYVLPVDRSARRVALCRQFRAGKYLTAASDGWTLEAPGGLIDEGDDPATTAWRECKEELGVVLASLEHMATLMIHPGLLPERAHLYIGECSLQGLRRASHGLGTDEETELVVVPLDQLLRAAVDGEVDDMKTFLLLVLLDAFVRE